MTLDRDRVAELNAKHVLPLVQPSNVSDEEWAQMQAERAARVEQHSNRFDAARARLLAVGADDGRGFCKYCGIVLGTSTVDGRVAPTHDINTVCVRPQRCDVCAHEWTPTSERCETCPKCHGIAASTAPTTAVPPTTEMKQIRRERPQRGLFGERDHDDDE